MIMEINADSVDGVVTIKDVKSFWPVQECHVG